MKLTVPERHQLKIARQTLKMSDVCATLLGGMTKQEAEKIVRKYQKEKRCSELLKK